jgi:hypothetical protein
LHIKTLINLKGTDDHLMADGGIVGHRRHILTNEIYQTTP